jgi:adenylyltransferase/sulfurtransferase
VLLIGAGGLGVPALYALAARGVRQVTVLDPDRVELSNLHRQVAYRERDIGRPKAEAIALSMAERFPDLSIRTHARAFAADCHELVRQHDVVLDGTDHFDTKLAISDACVDRGVPYVFAAVAGYEGQVLACRPERSACLRCFFDEAPPPGAAPTCAELGILGPVAGIVAAKQAEMAVRLLAGDASALDRLWLYDGARDRERTIELRRAADCKGCGANKIQRGASLSLGEATSEIEAPIVDLSGRVCPDTFILTRRALDEIPAQARVWIHLTSDEAARSIPRSVIAAGHNVLAQISDGNLHRVLIERGSQTENIGELPMAITVRIPTPLRKYTDNKENVLVQGATVRAVIDELDKAHPGIKDRLCDEKGALRRFVNIYYRDEDIRFLDNIDTKLDDGSELTVVPAIAGGA